jgi:aspartate/methionine/tyrosine aminotransferase
VFAPTEYIRWARRFYGRVAFDLASSGMTSVRVGELGELPSLDEADAWETLRGRIARHNDVPGSEVLPTLGTTHAIFTIYAALIAPGDEVLVERPTYEPMYRIPEGLGARIIWFDRSGEHFAIDPERIRAAMTPRTRVIALTNLHNPGGSRTSDETLRAVAAIAAKHGAHVLVDEVYAPFDAMCGPDGKWTGSARHLAPNVAALSSLTKVYGLGAFRVGWMIAAAEVIARGEDALLSNLGHAPISWAALGVAAFDRLPSLAQLARARLAGKRAKVEAWVASRPHLRWSTPREGLFGFATDTRGGDLTAQIERAAVDAGVLVAPGAFFGVPNGFRLSWSIEAEKLDEGLGRLGEALR